MKLITAPSPYCGHAVIAMVTNTELQVWKRSLGRRGLTSGEIYRTLNRCGHRCSDFLWERGGFPRQVVNLRKGRKRHWCLWWNGEWFDPDPWPWTGEAWEVVGVMKL